MGRGVERLRNGVSRRGPAGWTVLAVVCGVLLGLAATAPAAAEVELQLLPVSIEGNAQVEFRLSFTEPVRDHLDGQSTEGWLCEPCGAYRVCADLLQIQSDRFLTSFSYVLYVQPRSTSGLSDLTRFRFSAKPIGRFLDQEALVDFVLTVDGVADSGSLRLPVHGISSDPFLASGLSEKPVRLQIGGGETISIDLTNRLQDLDVLVGGELRVSTDKPGLWAGLPTAALEPPLGQGEEFRLRPGSTAPGKVKLKPVPVRSKALLAAFFPFKKKQQSANQGAEEEDLAGVHDRITVYVPYRTQGGLKREHAVTVPIRFRPSAFELLIAVGLGALLGNLAPWSRRERSLKNWLRGAGSAVVMGIVAWLVAVFLVENDSQLRILGTELDPYQILPVGLLGLVVGLWGFKGVDVLNKIFGGRRGGGKGGDSQDGNRGDGDDGNGDGGGGHPQGQAEPTQ